jgi:cyclophilin family peptidyl-prolyl cis-trans isomerase|tara:strand:- start:873 stop:1568 length:696 start_codon:yes stop_codon:yes gene_type:complete
MNLLHNHLIRIVLFALLLIISCDEKKDIIIKKVKTTKKDLKKNTLEKEFRLSDDNVMEFFLEYDKKNKENKVRIFTELGEIDILLFKNTKFHRSNFIYLTKKNYFQSTQFYRVINNFVIQAGNSDNRKVSQKRKKIGRYLLPNDLNKGHTHKRGMVSMPSSLVDNPYKMASPFEFFIVQKKDGAHHLDGNYTVFGKVIKGMDTVDKIASRPTDDRDWPIDNIYINKVEIIN